MAFFYIQFDLPLVPLAICGALVSAPDACAWRRAAA